MDKRFPLEPFPAKPPARLPDCRVTASGSRFGTILAIAFSLRGALDDLAIAAPAADPRRITGLWDATCFEFFLAPAGDHGYWEFNLSPAGHWNVFRLSGYRQGMQEEKAFATLPFVVTRRAGELRLELTADLASLTLDRKASWRLAISTVLLSRNGLTSWWALAHPGPEADFHHPDGFLVEL